jgi:hypothetical protein
MPGSRAGQSPSLQLGRTAIGTVREERAPFTITPVAGEKAALLTAQFAGEPASFARRIDASGHVGPLLRFVDESVWTLFEGRDGRYTVATSNGEQVCLSTFVGKATKPERRGCAVASPSAIVPLGERFASIELDVRRPEPPPPPPKPSKRKKKKPGAPARAPKAEVSVWVRWASPGGDFDAERVATGLSFTQPLEGMRLVDARPRGGGADLLWFEWEPQKKPRSPLGSARLVVGSLKADGSFDKASKTQVSSGDLEYGYIREHRAPRLVTTDQGSGVLWLDKKLACMASRALPKLLRMTPTHVECAVAPGSLMNPEVPPAGDNAALRKILGEDPRRVAMQAKTDPGLVAWVGDRAYFLGAGGLRSAARADGDVRDEAHPFVAKRSLLRIGAFAPGGEGVAVVGDDEVVHVDALGRITASGGGRLPAGVRAPEGAEERVRIARIGDAFFVARGDALRLVPGVAAASIGAEPPPAARSGKAPASALHPDTSALVGGAERGVLLRVSGEGNLLAASVDRSGNASPLIAAPGVASPVLPGFAACERRAGGALVAGVSVASSFEVVAFALDQGGRLGPVQKATLPIRAGDFAVRLTALPNGGAILTDLARRRVVWLDDDARPLAQAAWPLEEVEAACFVGRRARAAAPAPTPGVFVRVPELAARGTCVVGEPTWAADGTLRWFASRTHDLDAIAEVGIARVAGSERGAPNPGTRSFARTSAPETEVAAPPPKPAACPFEMVSVGRRFCIDRFEAMLIDALTGEPISPDYPTTGAAFELAVGEWSTGRERSGNVHARAFPLPRLPLWPGKRTEPVAVSRFGARPSGFVSGVEAARACENAGKRLCSLQEFTAACRSEEDKSFPYGDDYQDGLCNVNRDDHPAATLHDNPSVGHLDPRLNRVMGKGRPLLQTTGESRVCRSRWGRDGAHDLVGNLDEWVDHGSGAFAGGFYSRNTKAGCDALVATHPRTYFDYSTGVRCCKDAKP